jgi:hypothetical protein
MCFFFLSLPYKVPPSASLHLVACCWSAVSVSSSLLSRSSCRRSSSVSVPDPSTVAPGTPGRLHSSTHVVSFESRSGGGALGSSPWQFYDTPADAIASCCSGPRPFSALVGSACSCLASLKELILCCSNNSARCIGPLLLVLMAINSHELISTPLLSV